MSLPSIFFSYLKRIILKNAFTSILSLSLTFVCGTAIAIENQTTLCTLEGQERKIEIIYPERTAIPCEVQYTKDGHMQVLWNAKGQPGYCEQRTADFIEKQRYWGWHCTTQTIQKPSSDTKQDKQINNETIESISR